MIKLAWMTAIFPLTLMACSSTGADTSKSENPNSVVQLNEEYAPLFGIWTMADGVTRIEIEICDEDKVCGRLIGFEGNPDAVDELNASFSDWGRPLCKAPILTQLKKEADGSFYRGRIYNPEDGETYHLMLGEIVPGELEAHYYLGADADEFVSVAISSALGDAPSIIDSAYLAVRAAFGEKHIGETEIWSRDEVFIQACQLVTQSSVEG